MRKPRTQSLQARGLRYDLERRGGIHDDTGPITCQTSGFIIPHLSQSGWLVEHMDERIVCMQVAASLEDDRYGRSYWWGEKERERKSADGISLH